MPLVHQVSPSTAVLTPALDSPLLRCNLAALKKTFTAVCIVWACRNGMCPMLPTLQNCNNSHGESDLRSFWPGFCFGDESCKHGLFICPLDSDLWIWQFRLGTNRPMEWSQSKLQRSSVSTGNQIMKRGEWSHQLFTEELTFGLPQIIHAYV